MSTLRPSHAVGFTLILLTTLAWAVAIPAEARPICPYDASIGCCPGPCYAPVAGCDVNQATFASQVSCSAAGVHEDQSLTYCPAIPGTTCADRHILTCSVQLPRSPGPWCDALEPLVAI